MDNKIGNKIAYNAYRQDMDLAKKTSGGSVDYKVSAEDSLGYIFDRAKEEKSSVAANNFDDFLDAKREREKEASVDEETRKDQEKEAAKEIRNNLSSEEIRQLAAMGIDVSGANLSDLMGVVDTMRANAHKEAVSLMFAGIKASAGNAEDLNIVGAKVKVSGTDVTLSDVSISDVVSESDNISNSSVSDVNKENFTVNNDDLVYLISNGLSVSKESLYQAHFSGSREMQLEDTESIYSSMKLQMTSVFKRAGYELDATGEACAKFMINNSFPINPETIKTFMDFQDIAGQAINDISVPADDIEAADVAAAKLYHKAMNISEEAIYNIVNRDELVTISAAYAETLEINEANESSNKGAKVDINEDKELALVTARRQMEEIRLSMTLDMAGKLAKLDINVETKELKKVVEELKKVEQQLVKDKLANANVPVTAENIELFETLSDRVSALGEAHAGVLGTPLKGAIFSVNSLLMENTSITKQEDLTGSSADFIKVKKSYEAVGTAPRADMGDSISKAFSNVNDILTDLGFDINENTVRAVRILGYNGLEITPDTINEVMSYDAQVNELMDTFYPEAVLGMIKDGINPLDVSIDELVNTIREKNYNGGVTDAENFATFLRDVEKRGNISTSERESYIGIYRVMNKLAKSKDREAGWLFANGSRLTVRNLVTAARSRRAAGMDFSIDDEFGLLEEASFKNDIISQIESGFEESLSDENNLDDEAALNISERISQFGQLDDELISNMIENEIELSIENGLAFSEIKAADGGIYQLVSEIIARLKFNTEAKDDMIDTETEHIENSLLGEDVDIDFSMDELLEIISKNGDISYKYENLRDEITEMMYEFGAKKTLTPMDISAIKNVQAGLSIVSKMAKEHRYQLPVNMKEGTGVMNLTIKSDEAARGHIELMVKGQEMGQVRAQFAMTDDGIIGYVESDTSDGNYALADAKETFEELLLDNGIDNVDVNMGVKMPKNQPLIPTFTGELAVIYETAVGIVNSLTNILV